MEIKHSVANITTMGGIMASLISNHGSAWKFSGGVSPTYTNGTDVLTCVSDGTSLYAAALTDFQ